MTVFAAVPVKHLLGTKSRLKPILDPAGRAGLTIYMMQRVLTVLREAGLAPENVCVVSPDRLVLETVREMGFVPLRQESRGLNPALDEAREWALARGAASLLVLPADLPLLEAADVRAVLGSEGEVVISPNGDRSGTNAILLRPPDAVPFLFGPGSYESHLRAARGRGLTAETREVPNLAFDLDTAEDVSRLDREQPWRESSRRESPWEKRA